MEMFFWVLVNALIVATVTYTTVRALHDTALFSALKTRIDLAEPRTVWGRMFFDMISCADCLSYWVAAWATSWVIVLTSASPIAGIGGWVAVFCAGHTLYRKCLQEKFNAV